MNKEEGTTGDKKGQKGIKPLGFRGEILSPIFVPARGQITL